MGRKAVLNELRNNVSCICLLLTRIALITVLQAVFFLQRDQL
jgi:hypothetical protein